MDKQTLSVSPEQLAPVRDYLQDIAKVIGKFQQALLGVLAHDAQYGLVVVEEGLASQSLTIQGEQFRVLLDMRAGEVSLGDAKWSLENYSAERIMQELRQWLARRDLNVDITDPVEYLTGQSHYDKAIAGDMADVFGWASKLLSEARAHLTSGEKSEVLLFPHHFDVSLSWFPSDKLQYTAGFLFGDDTISEPYVYVTAHPEPTEFATRVLSSPAYHQTAGFSGAILKCNDIAHLDNPTLAAQSFLASVLSA